MLSALASQMQHWSMHTLLLAHLVTGQNELHTQKLDGDLQCATSFNTFG